jgi:hypothetical protein
MLSPIVFSRIAGSDGIDILVGPPGITRSLEPGGGLDPTDDRQVLRAVPTTSRFSPHGASAPPPCRGNLDWAPIGVDSDAPAK